MLKPVEPPPADVAVIVARFQVPALHDGHLDLINSVCEKHHKVIIFLGLSPLKGTLNNPLDFESRKQMLLEKFPNVNVLYIKDKPTDEVWSRDLDIQIRDLVTPTQTVVLYGSRDSFIKHYKGGYSTCELLPERILSGTELRKQAGVRVRPNEDFRAGVIWGTFNRHPTCFTTVDVAVLNHNETELLLARKPNESLYRFIGGFSDVNSPSFAADAKREVMEEAGIEISKPEYIDSLIIDDWRYRAEKDKIKTIFFKAKYIFGRPQAADDIAEVRWFKLDKFNLMDIVPEHRPLLELLNNEMNNFLGLP